MTTRERFIELLEGINTKLDRLIVQQSASKPKGTMPTMDVKELATLLSLSENQVRRLASNIDDFPTKFKVGGSLRFDRKEVNDYLEAKKQNKTLAKYQSEQKRRKYS